MEYQDFLFLKRAVKAIFVEACVIYTEEMIDNLIMPQLEKYSIKRIATEATQDTQMDIDL